jgi:hypothetical protein
VSLVDIGQEDGQLVLRVHVRSRPDPRKEIPVEIDGIPVRVVRGDYKPEAAGS